MAAAPRKTLSLGKGQCLIIAEVGQAHDGSLGTAHAYIDAAARAGVDAVKFQTHIAEAESTPDEPWRVRFSPQDRSRYEYWRRMEFTPEQWSGLAQHARDAGLFFLSSAFSVEAVELLNKLDMPAWKVASGEVSNPVLLDAMLAARKPLLCSTGMSTWAEIDALVESVSSVGIELALLQCTSEYPCEPEGVGLNVLTELRARYGCPVGLSDHSGTIFPGLAAVTLGCDVLECHIVMSRESFGPDVPASLTTTEFKTLVDGVRFIERAQRSRVDKDDVARRLEPMRRLFTKSIIAARPIAAERPIVRSDLTVKKPGTGIPAARLKEVIGKSLRRAYSAGEIINEGDLVS